MSARIPEDNPLKRLPKSVDGCVDTGAQAAGPLGTNREDATSRIPGGVCNAKDGFEEAGAGPAAKSAGATQASEKRAVVWPQNMHRIAATASWDDLVLPEPQLTVSP